MIYLSGPQTYCQNCSYCIYAHMHTVKCHLLFWQHSICYYEWVWLLGLYLHSSFSAVNWRVLPHPCEHCLTTSKQPPILSLPLWRLPPHLHTHTHTHERSSLNCSLLVGKLRARKSCSCRLVFCSHDLFLLLLMRFVCLQSHITWHISVHFPWSCSAILEISTWRAWAVSNSLRSLNLIHC